MEQKACFFQMNDGTTRMKIVAFSSEAAIKIKDELVKTPQNWTLYKIEKISKGILASLTGGDD